MNKPRIGVALCGSYCTYDKLFPQLILLADKYELVPIMSETAAATGENSRATELTLKKLEAEVELKESQGQLHRLKTAIAEGRYLPAEQVTEEMTEFLTTFKKFALNIPPRMAGSLSGSADAVAVRAMEKATRKELEKLLATFTDGASIEREDERL